MKKFLTIICTALLVALLALTLSGCSKDGDIKDAFKKAGYEVTQIKSEDCKELNTYVSTYITNWEKKKAEEEAEKATDSKSKNSDDEEEDKYKLNEEDVIKKFKVYTCQNGNRKAAFIKFPSKEALELTLGETKFESETDKGYINGDCYFLVTCNIKNDKGKEEAFFTTVNNDALNVFKNA